jgi:3D (Asp-Asp-Asp) domain-containing protein
MGLLERVVKLVLEDERPVQRVVAGQRVVRPAVDEVVAVGPPAIPAVTLPGLPATQFAGGVPEGIRISRALTMEATAYDPGPISTGKRPGDPGYGITASGMRAAYGVVAVDPRVIPFYTRLYVPGYGFAVAGDTGSAIVGNRIDVFFPTYDEAIRWGRRPVTVYVLE